MSNIGKVPVQLNDATKVELAGSVMKVTGPKGELKVNVPEGIQVEVNDGQAVVQKKDEKRKTRQFYGLTRALIANAVTGVNDGFEKTLQMEGVGFRAKVQGRDLVLNVGYANAITITPPEGIDIKVQKNDIIVSGIDKEIIGNTAAEIRRVRPPEPYKGKGIRFKGEYIRRKAGKAAKTAE